MPESNERVPREQEMAYGYLMEQVERVQAQNEELLERAERAEAAARDFAYEFRRMQSNGNLWMGRYGAAAADAVLARHPGFLGDE